MKACLLKEASKEAARGKTDDDAVLILLEVDTTKQKCARDMFKWYGARQQAVTAPAAPSS